MKPKKNHLIYKQFFHGHNSCETEYMLIHLANSFLNCKINLFSETKKYPKNFNESCTHFSKAITWLSQWETKNHSQ